MPWLPLTVETNPAVIVAGLLDRLTAVFNPTSDASGWVPRESSPEVILATEIAPEHAAVNTNLQDTYDEWSATFGITAHQLPAIPAARATIAVEVDVTGAGVQIPAGFTVTGITDDGAVTAFSLPTQITATSTTVLASLTALRAGTAANGVPTGPLRVVSALTGITAVTAVGASTGGIDEEDRTSYLSRLVDYIALLRPGAVRSEEAAVLARNVPGVQRALAIDNYDAQTGASDAERTISLFPVDSDGAYVPTAVRTSLQQALEAVREVNFIFRIAGPSYTPVHVTYEAIADDGADTSAVHDRIDAAIADYISPARHGASRPRELPAGAPAVDWVPTPTIRRLDLARVAGSVDGVAALLTLQLNGTTNDVTLPGVAALPAPLTGAQPSTITGTVS